MMETIISLISNYVYSNGNLRNCYFICFCMHVRMRYLTLKINNSVRFVFVSNRRLKIRL